MIGAPRWHPLSPAYRRVPGPSVTPNAPHPLPSHGGQGDSTLPERRACGHQCDSMSYVAGDEDEMCMPEHCCRCLQAIAWFGLKEETDRHAYGRSKTLIAQAEQAGWDLAPVDATHPGWHAGLRRPAVDNRTGQAEPSHLCFGARTDRSIIRAYDAFGVVSGAGSDEAYYLCWVCRAALRVTPAWLFWHARGWTPEQSRIIAAQERILRRGPEKDPSAWPSPRLPWASGWNAGDLDDPRQSAGTKVSGWKTVRALFSRLNR